MESTIRYRKVWLFSHNDLDGYACNVVTRVFLGDHSEEIIERNCSYGEIEEQILRSLEYIDLEKDLVIVSDISWKKSSKDITDFMKSIPYGHLVIADHHKSSEWICGEINLPTVVTVEADECGCQILKDILDGMYLYATSDVIEKLNRFVDTVCEWDLWSWADRIGIGEPIGNYFYKPASKLATWFEWCLEYASGSKFVDTVIARLNDDYRSFGEGLQEEYDSEDFKSYVRNCVNTLKRSSSEYYNFKVRCYDTNLDTLLFVLPKGIQMKSMLSLCIENFIKRNNSKGFDCIAIWVEGDENLSIRCPMNGLDLSEALKNCMWGGGGHKFAAGTSPGNDYMAQFIKHNKSRKL